MIKDVKFFHNGAIVYTNMNRKEAECLLKASLDDRFVDANIAVRREYERDPETGERVRLNTYRARVDVLYSSWQKTDDDLKTASNMRMAYDNMSHRLDDFFENNLE